ERNQLNPDEIEVLRQWIAQGAAWTEPKIAKPKWDLKPEDIWAFQPLARPAVPGESPESNLLRQPPSSNALRRPGKHSGGQEVQSPKSDVQGPVDRFILAKLREKGLKPAPPADRTTLIRRATYDLTGLPPTPEEIDAFIRDKSP